MGKWEDTQTAYFDKEEKVMPERERMCVAQAMRLLHEVRDSLGNDFPFIRVFDGVFDWVDKAVQIMEHGANKDSLITQNDMSDLAYNMYYMRMMRDWAGEGSNLSEAFDVFIQWVDDVSMYIRYTGKTGFTYGNKEVSL